MADAQKIAERLLRLGVLSETEIRDRIQLGIDLGLWNVSFPSETVEAARKALAKDTVRIRKAAFKFFLENRESNADVTRRAELFDDLINHTKLAYPDWSEMTFLGKTLAQARDEFDAAIDGKPVKVVNDAREKLPLCRSCNVTPTGETRLSFKTLELISQCLDCARLELREVANGGDI